MPSICTVPSLLRPPRDVKNTIVGSVPLAVLIGVPMGLIAGIFALTIVASLAGDTFNLKEVLILSVILSMGSYAAFILLLKLQFPVWPTFIAG